MFFHNKSKRKDTVSNRPTDHRRLLCEPLEDRRMLSITMFVDADAAPSGDGLAWATAMDDLQAALSQAATLNADADTTNDVDSIWIAEGTYRPSAELEPGDVRSASFSLLDGVDLYGGFAGTEATLFERDLSLHTTTLSGDLGVIDDTSDNAYTVVYCGESITTTFDGLSVTSGNADGIADNNYPARRMGGGILNSGIMTLTNSIVSDNAALNEGGGIYNSGTLTLSQCRILENTATYYGGGIHSDYASCIVTIENSMITSNSARYGGGIFSKGTAILDHSTISDNFSGWSGGGIYNSNGTAKIVNSTVTGNSSNTNGGGVCTGGILIVTNSTIVNNSAYGQGGGIQGYNSSIVVTMSNSIIAGNSASLGADCYLTFPTITAFHNLIGDGSNQPLHNGVDGNIVGTSASPIDPMLGALTQFGNGLWGYGLLPGSPAIDGGLHVLAVDAEGQPLTVDLNGGPRIIHDRVDMGTTEYDGFIANAGGLYAALQGTSLVLDASNTFDPYSEIVSYEWDLDDDGQFDDASGVTAAYDTVVSDGSYTVALKVTDSEGAFDINTARVMIENAPPVADAAGPYTVDEGGMISFDASASNDPGNDILSYTWDLDGDGKYNDASGVTPTYIGPASGTYTIAVRATDSGWMSSTDTATFTVNNVGPTADAGGPYTVIEGYSVTLNASGSTDPGNDIVSYEWDLDGDGEYDDASGVYAPFNQTTAGNYSVSLKVTDDDGVSSTDDVTVSITVPQTITVTSLEDNTDVDGLITLREAVMAADQNKVIGDAPAGATGLDRIAFDPSLFTAGPATIVLDGLSQWLSDDIDIQGPGRELLTIDAAGRSCVFMIGANYPHVRASIDGLTITGGHASFGAGISNRGIMMITNSAIINNTDAGRLVSGGIYNTGTMQLDNCILSGNTTDGRGGAIYNNGTLTINDSVITENTAGDSYNGAGGGIFNNTTGTLTVINSLIMKNSAVDGGGIANNGALTITNSTITNNIATVSGASHGAGLCHANNVTDAVINNTIIAGNYCIDGVMIKGPDIYEALTNSITGSHNLIGNGLGQGSLVDGVDGNQVGTYLSPIDPRLSVQGYLLPGSPAIDAGDNALAVDADGQPLVTDQTGHARIVHEVVDIGAFEVRVYPFLYGDATLDGQVDGSDVTIVANHWQAGVNDGQTATWEMGDFNGDGKVDGSDVTILATNWQAGVSTVAAVIDEPVAVSEPLVRFTPPENIAIGVATVPVRPTAPRRNLVLPHRVVSDTIFARQAWSKTDRAAIARDIEAVSSSSLKQKMAVHDEIFANELDRRF